MTSSCKGHENIITPRTQVQNHAEKSPDPCDRIGGDELPGENPVLNRSALSRSCDEHGEPRTLVRGYVGAAADCSQGLSAPSRSRLCRAERSPVMP